MATTLRGVIFDWRGTLAVTPSDIEWCRLALQRLGRKHDERAAADLLAQIEAAPGVERLEAHGVDASATLHRETYLSVFSDAGLDADLRETLYALEADPALNPFAEDVVEILRSVKGLGLRVAILSDIHFDIRPAFVICIIGCRC